MNNNEYEYRSHERYEQTFLFVGKRTIYHKDFLSLADPAFGFIVKDPIEIR